MQVGCLKGKVIDGEDSEVVGGMDVLLYAWQPGESEDPTSEWNFEYRLNDPDHSMVTKGDDDGGFNYAFDPYTDDCWEDDVTDELVPQSGSSLGGGNGEDYAWYRVRVEGDDYRPSFFYFDNEYDETCEHHICASDEWVEDVHCNTEDFTIWPESPSTDHEVLPDFVPDLRNLLIDSEDDQEDALLVECVNINGGSNVDLVAIRTAVGVANVGTGAFELSDDTGDPEVGRQYVYDSTGSRMDSNIVQDAFEDHPTHGHVHVNDWTHLNLVSTSSACDDFLNRDDGTCIVESNEKLSFCVLDLRPFDEDIQDEWGENSPQYVQGGANDACCPNTNGDIVQGMRYCQMLWIGVVS